MPCNRAILYWLMIVSTSFCRGEDTVIQFEDSTATSGIDFVHTDGSTGELHIVETVASGLATFDYDNDGRIDIYFLNGSLLDNDADPSPTNRLYRNQGNMRFVDVTVHSHLGDPRYGLGVAVADYDNDGFQDVYLSNFGTNSMFHNNGDGTFTELAMLMGTAAADPTKVGSGAVFLDADGDGDLDLYVANYLAYTPDLNVTNRWRGHRIYPEPAQFRPFPDMFYLNNGDGTFTDVSHERGVNQHLGRGMGVVCGDYDNDGDTDIFVTSDGQPGNSLLVNDGQGHFHDDGILAGVALDASGLALGAMGVACGDYDNDQMLDFLVSSFQGQWLTLFKNVGHGLFEDVTARTNVGEGSYSQVTWGCSLEDLDNDGDRDAFVGCGHLIDNIEEIDDSIPLAAPPLVLRNSGGSFANVTDQAGPGAKVKTVARGVAFDDLDNDGLVDVVISASRRPPVVLRNATNTDKHWLQVRLIGIRSNRDGVGARVVVSTDTTKQIAEVQSGRGYQSHFGSRLHFGLGEATVARNVTIRWPTGDIQELHQVPANQCVIVVEE